MDTQILESSVRFIEQPFIRPLLLSSGAISEITEARVSVRVAVAGVEATGVGSIYLSDLWAWPSPDLSHRERDAILRRQCETIAGELKTLCGAPSHPLEMGLRLHEGVVHSGAGPLPALALAMCASPFDAAIHDAVGNALQCSAFDLYVDLPAIPSADHCFPQSGAANAVKALLGNYVPDLPAWLIVGKADGADVLEPWIRKNAYRCFKLKIMGADVETDVDRTIEVFHMARELGCAAPWLSLDSNEGNPDASSVREFLFQLRARDSATFDALLYLEQPTGRDIRIHSYDWTEISKVKPVYLDEGLTSLDLLDESRRQGWSGLALKTCKGHSFALVAAAWAKMHGLGLSMQDLTNPGYAAMHSALFAARIGCNRGVELNSPQYTPAANAPFLPAWQRLLAPIDGIHHLPPIQPHGLGAAALESRMRA